MSGTLDVVDSTYLPLAEETLATWIRRGDTTVNRFLSTSELSLINQAPHSSHQVSGEFIDFFDAAREAYELTDGLCNPTVLNALEAWGYRDDFEMVKNQPHVEPDSSLEVHGFSSIRLNQATKTLSTHGARLDFGSSAKAYIADSVAREVGEYTSVLVELGGDVALGGPAPSTPWAVGVAEDPEHLGAPIGLSAGGVATSSTMVRSWWSGQSRAHHIIDPRTARPATGPWRTVSVAARSCLIANAFSTASLLWGDDAPYRVTQAGWAGRFVRHDGSTLTVGGWPEEGSQ